MRRIVFLCLLMLFGLVATVSANLDAPAEKKVTVRSEISRGKSAVLNAYLETASKRTMQFINAVDNIIDKNQQQNTDTDAFYMGVYGEVWIGMVLREDDYRGDKFYYDRATSYYKQFRQKQKDLSISDDDLKKINTIIKAEWLAEWDKKIAK